MRVVVLSSRMCGRRDSVCEVRCVQLATRRAGQRVQESVLVMKAVGG